MKKSMVVIFLILFTLTGCKSQNSNELTLDQSDQSKQTKEEVIEVIDLFINRLETEGFPIQNGIYSPTAYHYLTVEDGIVDRDDSIGIDLVDEMIIKYAHIGSFMASLKERVENDFDFEEGATDTTNGIMELYVNEGYLYYKQITNGENGLYHNISIGRFSMNEDTLVFDFAAAMEQGGEWLAGYTSYDSNTHLSHENYVDRSMYGLQLYQKFDYDLEDQKISFSEAEWAVASNITTAINASYGVIDLTELDVIQFYEDTTGKGYEIGLLDEDKNLSVSYVNYFIRNQDGSLEETAKHFYSYSIHDLNGWAYYNENIIYNEWNEEIIDTGRALPFQMDSIGDYMASKQANYELSSGLFSNLEVGLRYDLYDLSEFNKFDYKMEQFNDTYIDGTDIFINGVRIDNNDNTLQSIFDLMPESLYDQIIEYYNLNN